MDSAVRVECAPMWLVGVGVATAVSIAPNGALRGSTILQEPLRQSTSCLGGCCWGVLERSSFRCCRATARASYRVLFGSCNSAWTVVCFPTRDLRGHGGMMRLHARRCGKHTVDHWEYGKLSPNKSLQPTPKPLRGFGQLSSSVGRQGKLNGNPESSQYFSPFVWHVRFFTEGMRERSDWRKFSANFKPKAR